MQFIHSRNLAQLLQMINLVICPIPLGHILKIDFILRIVCRKNNITACIRRS